MLIGLVALLACTDQSGTSSDSGPSGTDTGLAGNPLDDVTRPDAPEQSVDDLVAGAAALFDRGLPELFTLRDAYASFLYVREPECPGTPDNDPERVDGIWNNDCQTSDGVGFYGTGIWDELEETAGDATTLTIDLLASWELTDVAGRVMVAGGEADLTRVLEGDTASISTFLGGTYTYDDGWSGWLDPGVETSLFATVDVDGATAISLEGGVGWAAEAVRFNGLTVASDTCDGLPQGGLELRDTSGYWVQVAFAGCEPCGAATFLDTDLGDICLGEALAHSALAYAELLTSTSVSR